MKRIMVLSRRQLVHLILAFICATALASVFLPQQAAEANATNVPILLLHGMEGYNSANCTATTINSNTYDRWDGFLNLVKQEGQHWSRANMITLKYYNGDSGCDQDIGNDSHCSGYHDGNVGTNNEDIRHIACRLYWYIYNKFTSNGQPVHILAHSLGGIITKYMLSKTMTPGADASRFPTPLLIHNVVALSSPFQGVPGNWGPFQHVGSGLACSQCFEGLQLEGGTSQSIISELNGFTSTQGYWTLIASYGGVLPAFVTCDLADVGSPNTLTTPGQSLSSAQVVDYSDCVFHEEGESGSFLPGSTSYQDDTSTNLDYSGYDGTVNNLGSYNFRLLPHPLFRAYMALEVTRGLDAYNCYAHPSDANCDNQDYLQQACPDFPQQGNSDAIVSVQLQYAGVHCQTNWTSAYIKPGNSSYVITQEDIERADGKTLTDYPGYASWYTNMLWSPTLKSRGCVWYTSVNIRKIIGPVCTPWQ